MNPTTGGSDVGAAAPSPVDSAAAALAALNEEQLRTLFDQLVAARRGTGSATPANPPPAGQDPPATSTVPKSRERRRRITWLFGIGAALVGSFVAARSILRDREVWKNGIAGAIPWGIGLIAAPFVVPWSFDRDRAAAQPHLSIEYAFLQASGPPMSSNAQAAIGQLAQDRQYRDYAQLRPASANNIDLAMVNLAGVEIGRELRSRAIVEAKGFVQHLTASLTELDAQLASLETLDEGAVQALLFRLQDEPPISLPEFPRKTLGDLMLQRRSQMHSAKDAAARLAAELNLGDPEVRLRLTILNRGATDGLVRHKGVVEYRGKRYPLSRAAAPSSAVTTVAVPVFQTNQPDDEFSPQSVGKVEQDSMVEFWFSFRISAKDQINPARLCETDEKIAVTLYDQNKDALNSTLECNQEGVE